MDENNVKEDSVKEDNVKEDSDNTNNFKGITLNDLILLKQIVNLASRRGAFSAEEFKEIGDVYSKLDSFISVQMKVLEDSKESSTCEDGNKVETVK